MVLERDSWGITYKRTSISTTLTPVWFSLSRCAAAADPEQSPSLFPSLRVSSRQMKQKPSWAHPHFTDDLLESQEPLIHQPRHLFFNQCKSKRMPNVQVRAAADGFITYTQSEMTVGYVSKVRSSPSICAGQWMTSKGYWKQATVQFRQHVVKCVLGFKISKLPRLSSDFILWWSMWLN